jgi:predicted ATPase/DNA-binding SARP family transcriptional activator
MEQTSSVRFGVLGAVTVDGRRVAATLERRLLAVLLVHRNAKVRRETLIEALWPHGPPAKAVVSLQSKLSRLRSQLGTDCLVLDGSGGVVLRCQDSDLDDIERVLDASSPTDPALIVATLDKILSGIDGPPFGEFAGDEFASAEVARIEALVEAAELALLRARLDLGDHDRVLADCRRLITRDPFVDGYWEAQATALARSGRTVEALRSLHDYRTRLADDIGLEFPRSLSDLERRLLMGTIAAAPVRTVLQPQPPPIGAGQLFGRDAVVRDTQAALAAGRMVTLTGAGGLGKSRVAIEVARRLRAAGRTVAWCSLGTVDPDSDPVPLIARSLGVKPAPGDDPWAIVLSALARSDVVVVLDSCEHIVGRIGSLVSELMARAEWVTVLATSRERFRVAGERVVRLGALGGTDPAGRIAGEQLLVQRAREAGADIDAAEPTLGALVDALDGLPLAIELMAPSLVAMTPAELLASVTMSSAGFAPSTTAHHLERSLHAAIARLDPPAARLFHSLAVYVGGWDLEGAASLCAQLDIDRNLAGPLLADLVDRSMVVVRHDGAEPAGDERGVGGRRFSMLRVVSDEVRARLDRAGRLDEARAAHARWCLDFAQQLAAGLNSRDEAAWVRQMELEWENLAAARSWLARSGQRDDVHRLIASLLDPAVLRERSEVEQWAIEASDQLEGTEPANVAVLAIAANAHMVRGRLDEAATLARRAIATHRPDLADERAPVSWPAANVLALLSAVGVTGDRARTYVDQLRSVPFSVDPMAAAVADFDLVFLAAMRGEPERAIAAAVRLARWARKVGNPSARAMADYAGGVVRARLNTAKALAKLEAAADAAASVGNLLLERQAQAASLRMGLAGTDVATVGERARHIAAVLEAMAGAGHDTHCYEIMTSALDPLMRVGLTVAAAVVCGGLSGTPWQDTVSFKVASDLLLATLSPAECDKHRRRGQRKTKAELVKFCVSTLEEVASTSRDL